MTTLLCKPPYEAAARLNFAHDRSDKREAMVTFETKCWEGDWEALLKTDYLRDQIGRNCFSFANRLLFINNVRDPEEVSFYAHRLVLSGVLTGYYRVNDSAQEVLDFFALSQEALGRGYVYSIAELSAIYFCPTPYLLHFSGDSILEHRRSWIVESLRELEHTAYAVVANPTWNGCYEEAQQEAHCETGPFYIGYGFSDQCYLVRRSDFRARIYGETHPLSARYPAYGGELFEKRVDSWMRNHRRVRLTHKRVSYLHSHRTEILGPSRAVETKDILSCRCQEPSPAKDRPKEKEERQDFPAPSR